MADFEKFDLTKNVPITYGNSAQPSAQASDEPMQVGWFNVKYGTFFQLGELAASERTTEMLISGEVIRVYSGPGAKWACPDCSNAQRFSHRGCNMFATPHATADVERELTNAEIRTIMHKSSRYMGQPGYYSDTEFDCLQDVISFARAIIDATKGAKP